MNNRINKGLSIELFENFWNQNGKYLVYNNPRRFHDNLVNAISTHPNVSDLDEYVCVTQAEGKETLRKVVVEFYKYVSDKEHVEVPSVLYNKHFYDDPTERRLEIAKFLSVPRTAKEIEEEFGIGERTRRADLQALEDGINVLGSTVKLTKEKSGRSYKFKTSIHPIFLPLNLTEAYTLTVYMKNLAGNEGVHARTLQCIIERIISQLSDYAFERLFPGEKRDNSKNYYLDDQKLAFEREGIYLYLMKTGKFFRFIWNDKKYRGRLELSESVGGGIVIRLENGEVLGADLNEVIILMDELEYE